ncbi:MAG: hypothetical protein L0Z50_02190 [Verrucomicrobiales bacterium]|nr:hypothetical protein [Verrucomicrobiales bacterium]
MQVTIDLPERLARRLAMEMDHLAEIIEHGLASRCSKTSGLWREVATFLARGPRPEEIAAFRPSESFVERSRELLYRNREGLLTPEEEAELDEMASLDHFMMLVKAEARKALAMSENA